MKKEDDDLIKITIDLRKHWKLYESFNAAFKKNLDDPSNLLPDPQLFGYDYIVWGIRLLDLDLDSEDIHHVVISLKKYWRRLNSIKKAPFTKEQVEKLNAYQAEGRMHPFTCVCSGSPPLVATEEGWICNQCDYTQDWAHDFMIEEQKKIC